MANLQFNDEQFGQIVGAAVMQSITTESRDVLIQEAIKYLLTKDQAGYYKSDKKSPLQNAFSDAVYAHAKIMVSQVFESEIKDKLEGVIKAALEKAFESEIKDKMTNNMATAIANAFKVDY